MWTNKRKNWVNDMLYNSVIDWCYTFPCAFLHLLFNFNPRWVIYLCFYPFLHQESGTGFYACVKNCLLKTFLGFTTIFRLGVERKLRYQSLTTQIMASYQQTRAWWSFISFGEQKFLFWEQKFPWGSNNWSVFEELFVWK